MYKFTINEDQTIITLHKDGKRFDLIQPSVYNGTEVRELSKIMFNIENNLSILKDDFNTCLSDEDKKLFVDSYNWHDIKSSITDDITNLEDVLDSYITIGTELEKELEIGKRLKDMINSLEEQGVKISQDLVQEIFQRFALADLFVMNLLRLEYNVRTDFLYEVQEDLDLLEEYEQGNY